MNAPIWLDKEAKRQWKIHYAELAPRLNKSSAELLALFCQVLSDYRAANIAGDNRQKKLCLDFGIKYAKLLGIGPNKLDASVDTLDDFIEA